MRVSFWHAINKPATEAHHSLRFIQPGTGRNYSVSAISEDCDLTNSFRERINTPPLILIIIIIKKGTEKEVIIRDVGGPVREGRNAVPQSLLLKTTLENLGSQAPGQVRGPQRELSLREAIKTSSRPQRRDTASHQDHRSPLYRMFRNVCLLCACH